MSLKEDHAFADVTTSIVPGIRNRKLKAKLVSKAEGVFCGAFLLNPLFSLHSKNFRLSIKAKDGEHVFPGQTLAIISGAADTILACERTFLNLACHLSGISTLTKKYVDAVQGTKAKILDTRKTTPIWRDLEKYAVVCGGGHNHRMSLSDAVLLKDNHLQFFRNLKESPSEAVLKNFPPSKKHKLQFVEMEAANELDVWEAIKAKVDIILLDNMTEQQVKDSIILIESSRKALNIQTPYIEVSGGMTLDKVKKMAQLGVDRISVGALTHSAPNLDLSLEVQ